MRVVTIAVVCLGLVVGVGLLLGHASSSDEAGVRPASPSAAAPLHGVAASPVALAPPAPSHGYMDYGLIAAPLTENGDIVGYHLYMLEMDRGRVWAWLHGEETKLVRILDVDE
jgi:hypothetical protein